MKRKAITALLIMMIAAAALYLYIESNWLQVTYYQVNLPKPVEGLEGFRILHLSDLHSKVFGNNNSRLIRQIKNADPDIIVMSGDMIDATGDDGTVILNLVRNLESRYPIFYSLGNHEQLAEQNAL